METPNVPVVPGSNQTPPPVQSPSPLHDKSMKWNILIGGGLLVVGLFSYFLAGGGIFKGQIKLADVAILENCVNDIPKGGFKVNEVYQVSAKGTKDCGKFVSFASSNSKYAEVFSNGIAETVDPTDSLKYSFKSNNILPKGEEITFGWDFGDGTNSSDANTSHTYTAAHAKSKGNVATIVTLTATTKTKDGKPLVLKATREILPVAPAMTDAEAAAAKAEAEAKAAAEAAKNAEDNAAAPVANISNFSAVGDATIPANEKGAESISFSKFGLSLNKGESQINGFTLNVAVEDPANIGDIRNILIYDGGLKIGGVISPVIGANTITFSTSMQISSSIKELTIIANFNKVTADGVYKITLKGVNFSDDKVTMDPAAIKELSEDKYFASKTSKVEMATVEGLEKKVAVYNSSKNNELYFETSESKMKKVQVATLVPSFTEVISEQNGSGDVIVNFEDTSSDSTLIKKCKWDFGDTVSGNPNNAELINGCDYTHIYVAQAAQATYKVNLTLTDKDGKTYSVEKDIVIPAKTVAAPAAIDINNNLTVADPEWDAIENKYKVVFTLVPNFGNNGMKTYSLNFGDGQTPYSEPKLIDTHFYTATDAVQPLQAILTIVDHDGKTFTATKTVKIPAAPLAAEELIAKYIPNIEIGKTEGLFVKFLNGSTPFDKITSYKWNPGDGTQVVETTDLEHVYKYPALKDPEATYKLALTVSDGAASDEFSSEVTIKHPVYFKISCIQRPGTLLGTCTLDPFVVNYSDNIQTVDFDFGDGTIITKDIVDNIVPSVGHEYAKDGVYNVVVTMTDDFGLADLEKDFDFTVVPAAEAKGAPQVSASAYLYADSFHMAANSIDIENGDYEPSAPPLKDAITVGAGDAVAIVTYEDSGLEKPIHINFGDKQWNFGVGEGKVVGGEKPTAPKAVCSVTPETGTTATEFTFSGKGSTVKIGVGRWDFGDKTTPVSLNSSTEAANSITHKYATAGTYTASLTLGVSPLIYKCEKTIVVSAAEKTAAEKAANQPATPATPAQPVGNTTINNYYNTTTNTTTTPAAPATPVVPAAPTEGISRSVISPTIYSEKATASSFCSGLVDTKSPIVLDDTLNSTVGFLTQLKYKNDRVINGYNSDGKVVFNAAKEISNVEFFKILFYGTCTPFSTTTTEPWYSGIWKAAIDKQLVTSSDDPNAQLTIREAMVIISKVATVNKAPSTFKQYFVDVSAKDKDYSKFQDMAYNDIYLGRLVNGERRADPSGLVLREVAASILNNYLSK